MRPFMIHRSDAPNEADHLARPLPVACSSSLEEIPAALSSLHFTLSKPTLLVLGTLSEQSKAQGEVCFRYCAEVITRLAQKHYIAVITDGKPSGLAGILGNLRAPSTFDLFGVKRAQEGDELGENVDLYHSHLLTLENISQKQMITVRLEVSRVLAQEIGPVYYQTVVVCMGGDASTWVQLRAALLGHFHVIIVGGSGGVAGAIARAQTYQQEVHRIFPWGTPRPKPTYSLGTLNLQAAGLLSLYSRPGMWLSVVDGEENTDYLYSDLKREFHIHTNE